MPPKRTVSPPGSPSRASASSLRSPESQRLKLVPAPAVPDLEEQEADDEQEQLLGDSGASSPDTAGAGTVRSERGQIFRLAWPVAATFLLQSSTQQMTIIFVGQLGALQLGAASMANMWINITGMSIIYGGMSAFDTLGSQAYGARNYPLVGLLAQRCLAICTLLCIPISLSWWFLTGPALVLVGIEQDTADLAAQFARVNILCLWPTLAHNVLQRFLRSQGVVRPVTLVMGICSVGFAPVAWWFVDRFGFIGAPLANAVLNWFLLIFISVLVLCKGYHKQCWHGWSMGAFRSWGIILKLGTAGVMGNMGQWWSWEIAAGMAGNLGEVPLAAHSVLQNVGFFMFPLTFGISTATTVRVGTLLGAGRGALAKTTSRAALSVAGGLCVVIVSLLLALRNTYPRLYSKDERVIAVASSLTYVYAFYQTLTSLNFCLGGILNGCGRQQISANIGIVAWYIVGLPS